MDFVAELRAETTGESGAAAASSCSQSSTTFFLVVSLITAVQCNFPADSARHILWLGQFQQGRSSSHQGSRVRLIISVVSGLFHPLNPELRSGWAHGIFLEVAQLAHSIQHRGGTEQRAAFHDSLMPRFSSSRRCRTARQADPRRWKDCTSGNSQSGRDSCTRSCSRRSRSRSSAPAMVFSSR